MKVRFRTTRPAWSKRQYCAFLVGLWIYTVVWLVTLVVINLVLPFGIVAKVAIDFILIMLTPTDGHFMSYEKYRRWHAEHVWAAARD